MTADFTFHTPTKVVFGKDAEKQVGSLILEQNCRKVLVHYGSGSVLRSGLLDRIVASLEEAHVKHVLLGGVVPNPRLSKVHEGIELGKKEGVDFILAVGCAQSSTWPKPLATGSTTVGKSGTSTARRDPSPDACQ